MDITKKFLSWVKAHKKELIIAGVAILAVITTALCIKNADKIAELWKSLEKRISKLSLDKTETGSEFISKDTFSESITQTSEGLNISEGDLTGRFCTARELGEKMHCSAQEINKRIVERGFAINPSGKKHSLPVLTVNGEKLGKITRKTTKYDYTFYNCEWDECILNLLFSPEEIRLAEEKTKYFNEIISNMSYKAS